MRLKIKEVHKGHLVHRRMNRLIEIIPEKKMNKALFIIGLVILAKTLLMIAWMILTHTDHAVIAFR
jgi:hypothetical protein